MIEFLQLLVSHIRRCDQEALSGLLWARIEGWASTNSIFINSNFPTTWRSTDG